MNRGLLSLVLSACIYTGSAQPADDELLEFPIDKAAATKAAMRALELTGGVDEWGKDWNLKNPKFAAVEVKAAEPPDECVRAGRYVVVYFEMLKGKPRPHYLVFEHPHPKAWYVVLSASGMPISDLIAGLRSGDTFCH